MIKKIKDRNIIQAIWLVIFSYEYLCSSSKIIDSHFPLPLHYLDYYAFFLLFLYMLFRFRLLGGLQSNRHENKISRTKENGQNHTMPSIGSRQQHFQASFQVHPIRRIKTINKEREYPFLFSHLTCKLWIWQDSLTFCPTAMMVNFTGDFQETLREQLSSRGRFILEFGTDKGVFAVRTKRDHGLLLTEAQC